MEQILACSDQEPLPQTIPPASSSYAFGPAPAISHIHMPSC